MVKANGKMFIEFIEFALDETISLLSPPRLETNSIKSSSLVFVRQFSHLFRRLESSLQTYPKYTHQHVLYTCSLTKS